MFLLYIYILRKKYIIITEVYKERNMCLLYVKKALLYYNLINLVETS